MADTASGGRSIGSMLHDLNVLVFEKHKKITSIAAAIIIPGLTFLVFTLEANAMEGKVLGASDIRDLIDGMGGGGGSGEVSDYVEYEGTISDGRELSEGDSFDLSVNATDIKVIKSLKATLTWKDETDPPGLPHIRRYENTPDTFSLAIVSPNGTRYDLGESDAGSLSGSMELSEKEMLGAFGAGDFKVTVTMVTAGDWEPVLGPGVIVLTDSGNSYSLQVEETYLGPATEAEE